MHSTTSGMIEGIGLNDRSPNFGIWVYMFRDWFFGWVAW